jgi:hypothetical protein
MRNFSLALKPGTAPMSQPFMARRPGLGNGGDFMDSNLINIITDFSAASISAYVAYGMTRIDDKWAPLFWVFSAMSSVKLLHDIAKP